MVTPLPGGPAAVAVPAATSEAASWRGALPVRYRPYSDLPSLSRRVARPARETSPAARLVDEQIEHYRDQEDEPLYRAHPGAGQPGGDEARLDHPDDDAAEDGADDGGPAAEDRRAADEHGRRWP